MSQKNTYHHGDLKNALIQAGIAILAEEGVSGLSLRKAARRAGVSHAAPYAHFADKQALIAAISTEGFRRLYEQIAQAIEPHTGNPRRQLLEAAWAYLQFAQRDPAHFKITFSGVLEKEKDYPAFVEISQQSFRQVVGIVEACQSDGVLREGDAEMLSVGVWSAVHGFTSLVLEGQVSRRVLERMPRREMAAFILEQFTLSCSTYCAPAAADHAPAWETKPGKTGP